MGLESDETFGFGLKLNKAFGSGLDSVFAIFSVFHCFFFATELLDNAALCLLVCFFYKDISTFLSTLSSIFFRAMTLASILFFLLVASTLVFFFSLATSALALFFSLTSAVFVSLTSFLALIRVILSGIQYCSAFELLPDWLPDNEFHEKVLNDEFGEGLYQKRKSQ